MSEVARVGCNQNRNIYFSVLNTYLGELCILHIWEGGGGCTETLPDNIDCAGKKLTEISILDLQRLLSLTGVNFVRNAQL